MFRPGLLALLAGLIVLSGGLVGQDKKTKEEPKSTVKKDEPPKKFKGRLPANWKKLGLTDVQVQAVYKVQNKYKDEIAKLRAKITELEQARDKEQLAVLTPQQKKRLDELKPPKKDK